MEKQSTIRDVAKLAGVSVATVSRVLCEGDYPVSAQLRQRVKDAAQTLGYVPNMMAKSLRQSKSTDVGVVVPGISNPFYMQAIRGINEVLSQNGYSMILCNTKNDPQQERMYLSQLAQRQVGGVILSSARDDEESAAEFARRGLRFVTLDQKIEDIDCPSINFDSRAGARMATEYLISMGHRRIAFATLPLTRWTRSQMLQGYKEALMVAGIPYDESLIYICAEEKSRQTQDQETHAGRCIGADLIRDGMPATAVLCVNDMLAIGLMNTLLHNGIRIPKDISVVGFDDIPFAEVFVPALTTVRYPAMETGRLAATVLLDPMIHTSEQSPLALNLTPQLVVRDTVRAL